MKSLEKITKPHILLFWSIPSISMVELYKVKSDKLKLALNEAKSVQIITHGNKILVLKKIGIEAGKFFGLETINGTMKKMLLNINHIKAITIL